MKPWHPDQDKKKELEVEKSTEESIIDKKEIEETKDQPLKKVAF
jgi:hypothetical protein